jgi:hypothetical protein
MSYYKIRIQLLLINVLLLLFPTGVMADEFNLIPSLALREEYNDNIFFSYSDTIDDFITTVSVGLELTERTDQLDLSLLGIVSPFFYADNSEWDDVDQDYVGIINYQVNPYLGVNANARYNVSNRPDRDVYTTGLVLSNTRRKNQAYGVGLDYTLTENSAMAVFFNYSKSKWDEVNFLNQNQKDYSTGLNYTHNLNQWWDETTGRLNVGFDRFEFETSDTNNYFTTIGVQHGFSQTINLLIDVGVRYTDANFLSSQLVEENNKSYGGIGQVILRIQGELTQGSVSVRWGITPASGRGRTVERSEAVLNLGRRLAEKLTIGIAGGFYHNSADKDEFSALKIDEDTYYIQPTIQWEIFERFNLQAGYNFIYIDDHAVSNDRKQNMVYLQASYGMPLFE